MRLPLVVVSLALLAPVPELLPGRARAQPAASAGGAESTPQRRGSRRRPARPAVVARAPGFRMNPDGTSRCTVRVSGAVTPTASPSRRRFEVLLPGAQVAARNDLHPLETEFFNTPLVRARLERRGRNLALVLTLRDDVTPTMRVESTPDGAQLVVVDLPAGRYVRGAPEIGGGGVRFSDEGGGAALAPGTGSVRPSAGSTAPSEPPPATQPRSSAPAASGGSGAGPSGGSSGGATSHEDAERPPSFR